MHCIFVNNGLLEDEYESVLDGYKNLGLNVKGVDASEDFIRLLKNMDPELKRKAMDEFLLRFLKRIKTC